MIVNGLNMNALSSMAEVLSSYTKVHPERKLFTFLKDGKGDESVITFADLDSIAKAIAAKHLLHYPPGSRVLIVAPNGLEYIYSLFACFYAGMIAVPVYPPTNRVLSQRILSVINDCQPSVALTTSKVFADIMNSGICNTDMASVEDDFFDTEENWIKVEKCNPADGKRFNADFPGGADVAMLQYTSGSTGTPKGVIITHANLMANEKIICQVFLTNQNSVCVNWLPFHHDMGLVGCLLQTVYASMHCVFMDPYHFVREPLNWLKAISRYRGTINGGPNFAFELLARRLKRSTNHTIDLSSWKTAFCGAEPIQAKTLDDFLHQSTNYGFDPKAVSPCYGLAEATLIVSGSKPNKGTRIINVSDKELQRMYVKQVDRNDPGSRQIVSCGSLLFDQNLYILQENSNRLCVENEIGEICISGPNITKGYWNNQALTEESFVTIDASDEKIYRTGDLGFRLDGHLYVSGRLKDLIIINGRNYFPQDIEGSVWTASSSLRHGSGACFSLEVDGKERLVVVQEIANNYKNKLEEIAREIGDKIFADFNIRPYRVVLIKRGTIAKTSSGKIRRITCKKMLKTQRLEIVHDELTLSSAIEEKFSEMEHTTSVDESRYETSLRKQICSIISQCCDLPIQQVSSVDSIDRLGLDSILIMQLKHQLEQAFDIELDLQHLVNNSKYDELLQLIANSPPKNSRDRQKDRQLSIDESSVSLTKSQEALWYLQNNSPESSIYHIAKAFNVLSSFKLSDIESAFKRLQIMHPVLNTVINIDEMGNSVQTLKQDNIVPIETISDTIDEKALEFGLNQWAKKAFELHNEKLYRIVFFSNMEKPVILFVFHHLICDFQSLAILYRDLSSILKGVVPERSGTGSFTDFVNYQIHYSLSSKAEEDRKYWRKHLKQHPITKLSYFPEKVHGNADKYRAHNLVLGVSGALLSLMRVIGRTYGFPSYTVLLASLQAFIALQMKQDAVAIGTAMNQRHKKEFQFLFGYCVNPVPLVQLVDQSLTVIDFITQTDRLIKKALTHSLLPISEIVEQGSNKNESNKNRLFDVILTYLSTFEQPSSAFADYATHTQNGVKCSLGSIKLEGRDIGEGYNQFPLEFRVVESRDKLNAELVYREDLISHNAAEYLGANWVRFLTWFSKNLGAPIADATEVLSLEAQSSNQAATVEKSVEYYPALHQLFEKCCDDKAESVALSGQKKQMQYQQVDDYTNQVARYIRSLCSDRTGCEPALIIAAASPEVICVLLALSKAGMIFVCLSEEYPMERIQHIIQDCSPGLIFLDSACDTDLPDFLDTLGHKATIVDINDKSFRKLVGVQSKKRLNLDISGNDIAYYAYTSGTTGKPKAIVHRHASLVSFIQWQAETFQIESRVNVAQQASMGFDVAFCEIFGALCFGANLELAENNIRKDPVRLIHQLVDRKINLIQLVPSYFRQLADAYFQSGEYSGIKKDFQMENLLFVGEVLTADVVAMASKMFPDAKIHNIYGPTECVAATHYAISNIHIVDPISIGKSIKERMIFLLNENNEQCKTGEAGEICIGGDALSCGYLNLDELTKTSFSNIPFGENRKVFRSGDLGRFDAQGSLFIVGRKDNQVKINGVRIELEEIDRNIGEFDSVTEACSFVKILDDGDLRLCVCIVFNNSVFKDSVFRDANGLSKGDLISDDLAGSDFRIKNQLLTEIKEQLAKKLPTYMMPSLYYSLPELPRNINSKVDRTALVNHSSMKALAAFEQTELSTQSEGEFVDVIKKILKVDDIDANKHFFDAGGNSLLAMRCVNYINRHYTLNIQLQDFTHAKSIKELALNIERKNDQLLTHNRKLVQDIVEEVSNLKPEQVENRILELLP